MMKFADGEFVLGCSDDECSIFIHKVLLVSDTQVPMHKDLNGQYFYRSPMGIRQEIER